MKSTYYSILIILVLSTFSSCKKDENKCNNMVCQNGGTCSDGTCNCTGGFTGPDCSEPKLFKTITISRIEFLNLPKYVPSLSSQTPWDEDGSAPDLVVRVTEWTDTNTTIKDSSISKIHTDYSGSSLDVTLDRPWVVGRGYNFTLNLDDHDDGYDPNSTGKLPPFSTTLSFDPEGMTYTFESERPAIIEVGTSNPAVAGCRLHVTYQN